jgi:hypothetical protein
VVQDDQRSRQVSGTTSTAKRTQRRWKRYASSWWTIAIDRLRVKPIVKIVGEFWAQITEGDGNFNMFAFLEREGAQVLVEPIGTWNMYMMYQVKERARFRREIDAPHRHARWFEFKKQLANEMTYRKKWLLMTIGERIYNRQYQRVGRELGEISSRTHSAAATGARWPTRSTTSSRAAAKDTLRSPRTSTTPPTGSATWFWRSSRSGACLRRSPMPCSRP